MCARFPAQVRCTTESGTGENELLRQDMTMSESPHERGFPLIVGMVSWSGRYRR
jgi:hypothetical protein